MDGDFSSWTPRPTPGLAVLEGRLVRLEPLDWAKHGEGLFAAIGGEANVGIWTYMPVGPFPTPELLGGFLATYARQEAWRLMVIRRRSSGEGFGGEILGVAAYMRVREAHGSTEIGYVSFGAKLRRTPEATEAFALMAGHVFDLGYRRYEWKCHVENSASKRSAERFGFTFEGIFRNDMVVRGRSRDTAWYSITDAEWPKLRLALEQWLAPGNFGQDGAQVRTLESFRT